MSSKILYQHTLHNGCKVFKFDFAPVTSHNYSVRLTEAQYSVIYQMVDAKEVFQLTNRIVIIWKLYQQVKLTLENITSESNYSALD